jgi:hypothetical protein
LYALHHQGRPPLFVVDFRITPSRARRTLQPTNRNKVGLTLDEALQQWQQHFAKDPNAMDLTPGHMHARGALTDNEIARLHHVTVSPSPQSKDEENEKLHKLREYARDFRRQHTTDAEQFDWDSDDGDYGLAIGRLVVT